MKCHTNRAAIALLILTVCAEAFFGAAAVGTEQPCDEDIPGQRAQPLSYHKAFIASKICEEACR